LFEEEFPKLKHYYNNNTITSSHPASKLAEQEAARFKPYHHFETEEATRVAPVPMVNGTKNTN